MILPDRKRTITIGLGAFGLLAVSVIIYIYLVHTRPSPEQINIKPPSLRVVVYPVKREDITEHIIGYGTARALRTSNVTAQVAATVLYRDKVAYAGEEARKGQLLFRLDERDYHSKVIQLTKQVESIEAKIAQVKVDEDNYKRLIGIAEVQKRIAEDEYKRVAGLFERKLAPKRELDLADQALQQTLAVVQKYKFQLASAKIRERILQSSLSAAKCQLDIAKTNLERCSITAPFDGQIVKINADVGQMVAPGYILAVITDPSKIEVPVELPASMRFRIKLSADVEITPEVRQPGRWRGKVSRIDATIDPTTRTFRAFVLVDKPQQGIPLVPGAFVIANITGATHKSVIAIPRSVIRDDFVFVAKAGKAHKRKIEIKEFINERAIISKGLKPGEFVITSNMDVLYNGAPVTLQRVTSNH